MSNNTNVGTAAPRNQNLGSFMDKLLGRQPIQAPATAQVAPVNSEPPTQPTQAQPAQPAQPVQPAPNASGVCVHSLLLRRGLARERLSAGSVRPLRTDGRMRECG